MPSTEQRITYYLNRVDECDEAIRGLKWRNRRARVGQLTKVDKIVKLYSLAKYRWNHATMALQSERDAHAISEHQQNLAEAIDYHTKARRLQAELEGPLPGGPGVLADPEIEPLPDSTPATITETITVPNPQTLRPSTAFSVGATEDGQHVMVSSRVCEDPAEARHVHGEDTCAEPHPYMVIPHPSADSAREDMLFEAAQTHLDPVTVACGNGALAIGWGDLERAGCAEAKNTAVTAVPLGDGTWRVIAMDRGLPTLLQQHAGRAEAVLAMCDEADRLAAMLAGADPMGAAWLSHRSADHRATIWRERFLALGQQAKAEGKLGPGTEESYSSLARKMGVSPQAVNKMFSA